MNGEPGALPREMVLASAGSGKTYHLSSNFIGLLARHVAPEEIWASTFTRKAASEILESILLRLARGTLSDKEAAELNREALLGAPPSEEFLDREDYGRLLVKVVHALHRTNIGTLDSFFVQVATTFARELGLPPSWRLVQGPEEDRMRSEALEAVLNKVGPAAMAELVRIMGKGEVRRGVHGYLLDQVDHLHRLHREVDPVVDDAWAPRFDGVELASALTEEEIRRRCDRLAHEFAAAPPPLTKAGKPNSYWQKELPRLADAVRVRDWKAFFEKGLGKKLVDMGQLIPAEEVSFHSLAPSADLAETLDEAVALARTELARDLTRQAGELERLAAWYGEAFEGAQEREGGYRFADITHVLRESAVLGRSDDLYFRLDARIQHILLDEFQDTSLPQWEVLKPMVSELLAGGETERSAVIVADPKQSIYGWRGAQPSLVKQVRKEHFLNLEKLEKSFRSGPVILDAVKEVFRGLESNAVVQEIDGGPAVAGEWVRDFYRQEANNQEQPGYVELRVGPRVEGRGGVQPALLNYAAALIKEIHEKEGRASIGVLVRTNKVVSYIIMALRKLGVPASGEGGTPLTDAAPVNALLALLRLADHPGDRLARYHVARTPVGEVVGYTEYLDGAEANQLALRVRRRLLQDGYGPTLDTWAEDLLPSCDPLESARLLQMVELGFQWDRERTLRPGDFVRFVEDKGVEDPSGAPVRVMTVHQSKGLQFDVVVLPQLYLSLEGHGDRDPVIPLRDEVSGRVIRVYPAADQATRALLPELQVAREQHRAFRLRDEFSALYVAMTRARYALHMVVPADGERGPGTTKNAARILRDALASGKAADAEGEVLYPGEGEGPQGDPRWFERLKGKDFKGATDSEPGETMLPDAAGPVPLKKVSGVRTRNLARRSPSSMEGGETLNLAAHLRLDLRGDARLRGTVVHAWCEALEWMDEGVPDDATLIGLARRAAPGVDEVRMLEWLSEFRVWMEAPAIRERLSRAAYPAGAQVERELPFLHRIAGGILQGYIDRLVIVREGERVVGAEVLDFKTDFLDGSDPGAVAAKVAFYRPQIDAYRGAVAGRYGLEPPSVTGKLLFLRPGVVAEV